MPVASFENDTVVATIVGCLHICKESKVVDRPYWPTLTGPRSPLLYQHTNHIPCQILAICCLTVLANAGCLGSQKAKVTPLGQPLNSKVGRGLGAPTDSRTAIEMLTAQNESNGKGWFAWTEPITEGWSKMTSSLMVTQKKPDTPHDRLSLDVESKPTPELYLGTAEYAASLGNLEEARGMLEKGLQLEPRADLKISLARVAVRQQDYKYADQLYQELLADNPQSPVLHNDLAMLYDQMGQTDRCYFHYAQAISLEPKSERYRNNLAARLIKDQKITEARRCLMETVDAPTADLTLSALLQQQGQTELAADFWRAAQRESRTLDQEHPLHDYFRSSKEQVAAQPQESSVWR